MEIQLTTQDKITISGKHYPVSTPSPGISLFHMMPATKESWESFAKRLQIAGIGVLAVDLRGHGKSFGGSEGYKTYIPAQHQASWWDVLAAIEFQQQEGHAPLFVGGASIGANLALRAVATIPEVKKAILISPGLNYRGIETLPLARIVPPDKQVFVIAARDDARVPENVTQAEQIYRALSCQKQWKVYETGGHGTDILQVHPGLMKELAEWLKKMPDDQP